MELINLPTPAVRIPGPRVSKGTRRKVNGEATAALLIQMATEILTSSPTLRKSANITLMDLSAAGKVRKELNKKSTLLH